MTIGGWDVSNADATQWNVTPGFNSMSNDSEWVAGSPIPALFENTIGFKTMTVTLLVRGERDRDEILQKCSDVISHLLEPVEFVLDGFAHKFYGILNKHSLEENPLSIPVVNYNRVAKLKLELYCYEYGGKVTTSVSGKTEFTVRNAGNIITPVCVAITPQVGAASITLTGLCRDPHTGKDLPVTIKNLVTDKTVVLDGETGLFTQDGEVKADIEIWGLPTLLPEKNTITVDNGWMDITLTYYPRYI